MLAHLIKCSNVGSAIKEDAKKTLSDRRNSSRLRSAERTLKRARTDEDLARHHSSGSQPVGQSTRNSMEIDPFSFGPIPGPSDQSSASFYGETAGPAPAWNDAKLKEFEADLCQLLIVCNVSWWAVDHPFFRAFFSKWVPGSHVPCRTTMSGRVLEGLVAGIVNGLKERVEGRYATGQCDGWKNIAKTALIASVINVEYKVRGQVTAQWTYI